MGRQNGREASQYHSSQNSFVNMEDSCLISNIFPCPEKMWSHITALIRQHPDVGNVKPYRFHLNWVSLSSVTALTTVLLYDRGSLVLDFAGSLLLFKRCLNLLTMLNQLTMKIMGLVCLPYSDAFLPAESLWEKWLEFVSMFELSWNIICRSICYFPEYDLMMMIKAMITAVIVQVTASILLFLLYINFILLPISLSTCSILFYIYFLIYFVSSPSLEFLMVPSWAYISSGAQPHNSWLLFILPGPNLLQFSSGVMPMKSSYINRLVQLKKKQSLISVVPWYIFSFIMSFSSHIFIYSFLYYFSAPYFTILAFLHSVAIIVVYLI